MSYDAPSLKVTLVRNSTPPSQTGTNVDLSARVREFSMNRGRQDDLSQWEPATASLILDNKDGDLDELLAGSTANFAAPFNKVTVQSSRPTAGLNNVFTGFALDGFYPISDPRSHDALVQLDLTDILGWGAQWPVATSTFDALVNTLTSLSAPRTYIKGEVMGGSPDYLVDTIQQAVDPKMAPVSGSNFVSTSGIMPGESATSNQITGASHLAQTTSMFWGSPLTFVTSFQVDTAAAAGDWIVVLRQTVDGTPVVSVRCNNDGTLTATVYNSTGTVTASATTSAVGTPRHDDGQMHVAIVRMTSASAISIWTDCDPLIHSTTHSITTTTSGMVHYGDSTASGGTRTYGPFAIWSGAMSDTEAALFRDLGSAVGDPGFLWDNDTPAQRMTHIYNAANLPGVAAPTFFVQSATRLNPYLKAGSFSNFGDEVYTFGESLFGAAYVDKSGAVIIRDYAALTTSTRFTTEVASLTDAVTPGGSPPAVRVSSRGRTAPLVKRALNKVIIQPYLTKEFVVFDQSANGYAGRTRYGLHTKTVPTMVKSHSDLITAANDVITRYQFPTIEIADLEIKPWNNTNETNFVLAQCDLEVPVHYSERPVPYSTSTALVDGTYRVIHESWDWKSGLDWTVTVRIAAA